MLTAQKAARITPQTNASACELILETRSPGLQVDSKPATLEQACSRGGGRHRCSNKHARTSML
eukprot:367072-Alexandrium_andersonii.AAC.1